MGELVGEAAGEASAAKVAGAPRAGATGGFTGAETEETLQVCKNPMHASQPCSRLHLASVGLLLRRTPTFLNPCDPPEMLAEQDSIAPPCLAA